MPDEKRKVYNDDEVQAKILADGLEGWTLEDGWLGASTTPTAGRRR